MIQSLNLNDIGYESRVDVKDGKASMITYPRIHMFSLDLSDKLNIRSGGMGISITTTPIKVSAEICDKNEVHSSLYKEDILKTLDSLRQNLSITHGWKVKIDAPSIDHVGMGSATQIIGSIIMTVSAVSNIKLTLDEIVNLGIGQVSCVGLSLLYSPGFLIEFGYLSSPVPKPGYFKHPVIPNLYQKSTGSVMKLITPKNWNIILATPLNSQSISGKLEDGFWSKHLPATYQSSLEICYSNLMLVIPSIISGNFNELIIGLNQIISQGTKPIEESIQNPNTKELLKQLRKKYNFASVSSLGPSVYTISQTEPSVQELKLFKQEFSDYNFTFFPMSLEGCKKKL